jgi:hypothetical protein
MLSVLASAALLLGHFALDHVARMSMNEGICPSWSKFDFTLRCTIICDLCSRDWCVLFCVLLHPAEDFLYTILVEGDMLSSLSGLVQPAQEGYLDTRSWTIECSRQYIHAAMKIQYVENSGPPVNIYRLTSKAKQFDVWQDDIVGACEAVSPGIFWPSM